MVKGFDIEFSEGLLNGFSLLVDLDFIEDNDDAEVDMTNFLLLLFPLLLFVFRVGFSLIFELFSLLSLVSWSTIAVATAMPVSVFGPSCIFIMSIWSDFINLLFDFCFELYAVDALI